MDRIEYYNRAYSPLDYLSDIGGFSLVISSLFAMLLLAFNHLGSYQFLMSDVYVESKREEDEKASNKRRRKRW